jgi:hypothetical protein
VELLDRYLYEVRRHLPSAQQDDIIAEISDAIQSQFEDRERQLGRPLTSSEEATIVKAFGHPKIVASRYQPAQYLIGPEIYPFYWYTLKIALAGALALELLGALIASLLSPSPLPAFIKNIAVMWPTIFLVLGVVTFIFVALERTGSSSSVLEKLGIDKWNPRALPRATQGEVPRFSLLIEALANILFMLWLLDFLPLRSAVGYIINASGGGKALAPLALTPAWHPLLLLAFLAAALIVLQDFVLLLSPSRTKLRAGTLLTANVLMVIGACLVLQSRSLVAVAHPATQAYVVAAQALNEVSFVSLVIFAVAITIAAAFNVRTLLKRVPKADLNISYETRPN